MSQTTKNRKGQKTTYLNPRGENKTIGLAKGRGTKKTKTHPGGTGTGVGVHSIGWPQSRKTGVVGLPPRAGLR